MSHKKDKKNKKEKKAKLIKQEPYAVHDCEHDHGHEHHHHHEHHEEPTLIFSIVTCSDTRSFEEDTAGAALEELIAAKGWTCVSRVVVKDDRQAIGTAIVKANMPEVNVVLTCGGTGLSPRDVTPEATRDVCDREVPGIAEGMRAYSLKITDRAMLSRATCGQLGNTLVVNLPGSEKAARENWAAIENVLGHAVLMMQGAGH